MPGILTAEDVVRRIAAECAYVDERGGVGIRLEPAAAIVRQYGEQFRRVPRRHVGSGRRNHLPCSERSLARCNAKPLNRLGPGKSSKVLVR
jgi:hypothetical protein